MTFYHVVYENGPYDLDVIYDYKAAVAAEMLCDELRSKDLQNASRYKVIEART